MTIQTVEHSPREKHEQAKTVRPGALVKIQHRNGTDAPGTEHLYISPQEFITEAFAHEDGFRSGRLVTYPRLPEVDEIEGLPLKPDFIISPVSDYGKALLSHEAGEDVTITNEGGNIIAQITILEISFYTVTFTPKVPESESDLC
jgi:hypothetical protein